MCIARKEVLIQQDFVQQDNQYKVHKSNTDTKTLIFYLKIYPCQGMPRRILNAKQGRERGLTYKEKRKLHKQINKSYNTSKVRIFLTQVTSKIEPHAQQYVLYVPVALLKIVLLSQSGDNLKRSFNVRRPQKKLH